MTCHVGIFSFSFMGGTNFWGGNKEDDCFIAPSFDDRVLEVVAVFGSVQMAASRIINLQHHRIAQCHSVKITILGDEGVPVQVDGEAWLQPPGLIRIVHKNRMQMLCRNRVQFHLNYKRRSIFFIKILICCPGPGAIAGSLARETTAISNRCRSQDVARYFTQR